MAVWLRHVYILEGSHIRREQLITYNKIWRELLYECRIITLREILCYCGLNVWRSVVTLIAHLLDFTIAALLNGFHQRCKYHSLLWPHYQWRDRTIWSVIFKSWIFSQPLGSPNWPHGSPSTGNPWTYLEVKRSKVKVTTPINVPIVNAQYFPNAKSYIRTLNSVTGWNMKWQRPLLPTSAMTSKVKVKWQGHVVHLTGIDP